MENDSNWWQKGAGVFLKMSSWIVAPVILGAGLGRWLDKKLSSEPWLFLFCTGFCFLFAMFGLVRTALSELDKIDKNEKDLDRSHDKSKRTDE